MIGRTSTENGYSIMNYSFDTTMAPSGKRLLYYDMKVHGIYGKILMINLIVMKKCRSKKMLLPS